MRSRPVAVLLLLVATALAGPAPAAAEPARVDVFTEGQGGFVSYRIPGLVVTARGTVLAYAEARKFTAADRGELEIHLRRSTDGGRSFGPARQIAHLGPRLPRNPHMPEDKRRKDMGGPAEQTVNNPMLIATREGPVHLVYCVEYQRVFHARSEDDGLSWSAPVEITAVLERFRPEVPWQAVATGPGHGVQLRGGRLVVPVWLANYDQDPAPPQRRGCAVIYSDDQGATWQRGDLALTIGGETSVAQLSDGRVMLSARNTDRRNRRVVVESADGATRWGPPRFLEEILEPGCMAGLVSHPGVPGGGRPLLLHSSPHTPSREHRERKHVSIHLSRDDGRTWPVRKLLQEGPSAYSDLAVLPDGTILCLYENGRPGDPRRGGDWAYARITLARFSLAWLGEAR
jgi:sialidase-1